jgi:hypothetical protein
VAAIRPEQAESNLSSEHGTKRIHYEIEPMDLANMRENGVRSLDV